MKINVKYIYKLKLTLESENKIQCIFEEYLWDVHCIVKRANDLANECYDEIFAIGDGVNFPLISKQMFEKFRLGKRGENIIFIIFKSTPIP